MKKIKLIILALNIIPILCFGQIGPAIIIDSSIETSGLTKFVMSDIDLDSDEDLVASFTGNSGKLAYYDYFGNASPNWYKS